MNCTTWSSPDNLVPTCMFGECNALGVCVCRAGFQHDLVLGRYYNCGLPDGAALALVLTCLALTIISVSYGSYIFFKRATWKSKLWRACGTAVASSFCFALALISLAANGYSMSWYGALFTDAGSVLSAHLAGRLLVGVLSPVTAATSMQLQPPGGKGGGAPQFNTMRYLDYCAAFFLWILPGFMGVWLLIALSVGYGTGEISLGMAYVFLVIALCAITAFPFLFWFTTRLIAVLEHSMGKKTDKIAKLLLKVRLLRLTSCLASFLTSVVCFLASALHFSYGTLPLSWGFCFAFIGGLAMFHLQAAHFSRPLVDKASSNSKNQSFVSDMATIENNAQLQQHRLSKTTAVSSSNSPRALVSLSSPSLANQNDGAATKATSFTKFVEQKEATSSAQVPVPPELQL